VNNEKENDTLNSKDRIFSLATLAVGYALYRFGLYLGAISYDFIGGVLVWLGFVVIAAASYFLYFITANIVANFFKTDLNSNTIVDISTGIGYVMLMGCTFYWSDYRLYMSEDMKMFLVLLAAPILLAIFGGIIYSLVLLSKRDKDLEALDTNSTKLFRDILPDMCFVGAPLMGHAPDDFAQWAKSNQNLMMASLLNIEEPKELELFTKKVNEYGVKTILIPEITDEDIKAQVTLKDSILHRSCKVITDKLGRDPKEFEYLTSVFEQDALGTGCSVGFCFVFKK